MKIGKKIIAAGLVVFTVGLSVVGCTPSKPTDDGAKYTYNTSIGTSHHQKDFPQAPLQALFYQHR